MERKLYCEEQEKMRQNDPSDLQICTLNFAKIIAGEQPINTEKYGMIDEFDPLWIDIGGEA